MSETQLNNSPLFIGATRPVMKAGVPYEYFLFNTFFTMMVFMLTTSLSTFLMFIPMHALGFLIMLKDPRAFSLYLSNLSMSVDCKNRKFWGCISYTPMNTKKY